MAVPQLFLHPVKPSLGVHLKLANARPQALHLGVELLNLGVNGGLFVGPGRQSATSRRRRGRLVGCSRIRASGRSSEDGRTARFESRGRLTEALRSDVLDDLLSREQVLTRRVRGDAGARRRGGRGGRRERGEARGQVVELGRCLGGRRVALWDHLALRRRKDVHVSLTKKKKTMMYEEKRTEL